MKKPNITKKKTLQMPSKQVSKISVFLFFAAMFAFQGAKLDCDPSPIKVFGDMGDEGFWQHSARCKVLFGTFAPDDFNQDVVACPLFTLFQWGAFSLLGISLYSARLICLVSLWLILLMLYVLVRRESCTGKAILVVATLGLMHEMLMYMKWSTPIPPEMCFLTAIIFFWEFGRVGNRFWMALSGASLIAAIGVKLTSLYFLAPISLFLGGAYWLRRDVDKKQVLLFVGGAAVAAVPLGLYFLVNYEEFQFFSQTIGMQNLGKQWSFQDGLWLGILYHERFLSPGVSILLILSSLWLLDCIVQAIRHGFVATIRQISTLDYYALCWIGGIIAVLAISPDKSLRRFIMLYEPLTILAVSFVFRQFATHNGYWKSEAAGVAGLLPMPWRATLWICMGYVWFLYVRRAIQLVGESWLTRNGANVPGWLYGVALGSCLIVSAMFFLFPKPKIAAALLMGVFLCCSTALNGIWYGCATYTLRDESKALRSSETAGVFLVGPLSHQLALENHAMPLAVPWLSWVKTRPFNPWFADVCDQVEFRMIRVDNHDGNAQLTSMHSEIAQRFAKERQKEIGRIRLCPIPLVGGYRFQATLCSVEPASDPAASGDRVLRLIQRSRP